MRRQRGEHPRRVGAASAASLVVRVVRKGEEGQQVKWFAYATALLVTRPLPPRPRGSGSSSPPASCATGLFGVDLVINRTLGRVALTASLALVCFGSIVVLQTPLRASTG